MCHLPDLFEHERMARVERAEVFAFFPHEPAFGGHLLIGHQRPVPKARAKAVLSDFPRKLFHVRKALVPFVPGAAVVARRVARLPAVVNHEVRAHGVALR